MLAIIHAFEMSYVAFRLYGCLIVGSPPSSRARRRCEWVLRLHGRYWEEGNVVGRHFEMGDWFKDCRRATQMPLARARRYRQDWASYGVTVERVKPQYRGKGTLLR